MTLSKSLIAGVPLVLVKELSGDNVHSLVVVLVDRLLGDLVLTELLHGS